MMSTKLDLHCRFPRFHASSVLKSQIPTVRKLRPLVIVAEGFQNLDGRFIGSTNRDNQGQGVELKVQRNRKAESELFKDSKKEPQKTSPPKPIMVTKDHPIEQQSLTVQASKKGRGGKTVTVISGFLLTSESLEKLAKKLKSMLGTGGAVKDNTIELQGNHTEKLVEEMSRLGYKARKSGR